MTNRQRFERSGSNAILPDQPRDGISESSLGISGSTVPAAVSVVTPEDQASLIQPRPRSTKLLLTVDDLAVILDVSRRTVFRLRARGVIPKPLRIGGTLLRWRSNDIDRFLEKSR